jgi:tetratricopeptide (TPR) repeat protein
VEFVVITIFPEFVEQVFSWGILRRAVESGKVSYKLVDPREHTKERLALSQNSRFRDIIAEGRTDMPGKKGTGFGNCVLAGLALCCVIMLLSPPPAIAASADTNTYSSVDTYSLALKGGELTEQEARKLEEELKPNPENLPARIQLLGYYFLKTHDSAEARKARQKHVLWIIEHCPDNEIAGSPWANLDPMLDRESYYEARELWLQQVKKHSQNAKVIANAASFFLIPDEDIAEELLKQGQSLEPRNPYWPERLGFLYMLEGKYGGSTQAPSEMMQKALEQYEKAASFMDSRDRASLLSDLANAAFGAGNLEKAESYALELLEKAGTNEGPWSYGNAIHDGNIVLGRIAIRRGDINEARLSC